MGANTVLFPESSATQDTVCLSLSSSIHTLSTHTTPQKKGTFTPSASDGLSVGQEKKAVQSKSELGKATLFSSILIMYSHLAIYCHSPLSAHDTSAAVHNA